MLTREKFTTALADKNTWVFDLDGTVLDTLGDLTFAVNETLKISGFAEVSSERVRQGIGKGTSYLLHSVVPQETEWSEEDFSAFLQKYRRIYQSNLFQYSKPYPGINDMLLRLKAEGKTLGVLTNKPDSSGKVLIEHFFPNIFTLVRGQREGHPIKPDPEALRQFLLDLGAKAADTVYLGDSDVDMLTGKNAGCLTVGVDWGYRPASLLIECGADYVLSFSDLERLA